LIRAQAATQTLYKYLLYCSYGRFSGWIKFYLYGQGYRNSDGTTTCHFCHAWQLFFSRKLYWGPTVFHLGAKSGGDLEMAKFTSIKFNCGSCYGDIKRNVAWKCAIEIEVVEWSSVRMGELYLVTGHGRKGRPGFFWFGTCLRNRKCI